MQRHILMVSLVLVATLFLSNAVAFGADADVEDAARAVVRLRGCHDDICDIVGSGTIIHPSGTILTAEHVALVNPQKRSAGYVDYFMVDMISNINREPEEKYRASLVATDSEADIALLQIFWDENRGELLFPMNMKHCRFYHLVTMYQLPVSYE